MSAFAIPTAASSLGYIASPSNGVVHLGPLPLHAYGLMLALGVIAAVWVSERLYAQRGGDPKEIADITIVVVIAGVIGARVYHLFTGYSWDDDGVAGAFKVWEGGLSIWGAVLGGLIAVVFLARKRHLDLLVLCDAIAPAVLLAQGIGRWGNYFNQELFGRPTTLPWALEIDLAHRPAGYEQYRTFHPTFLYESLWCFLAFAVLLWLGRRADLRRGQVFAGYIALYTFGRIWFEAMRIDAASKIFGIRFNLLVSVVLCAFGAGWFLWLRRHGTPAPPLVSRNAAPAASSASTDPEAPAPNP